MSRPPSVQVNRMNPDLETLISLFKTERDAYKSRRLHAIILMHKIKNAEQVAELCMVDADTIRRWVTKFNTFGLENGLYKKKLPVGPGYLLQKKKK